MGVFDPYEMELFRALEILDEEEEKGWGPFDALREESQWRAW